MLFLVDFLRGRKTGFKIGCQLFTQSTGKHAVQILQRYAVQFPILGMQRAECQANRLRR